MKITAVWFFTVLFACTFSLTFAQTTLHGKVVTDNASPANEATIILLRSRDSSVVQSTISAATGVFNFSNIQAGGYLIFITKLNYGKSYSGPYQVAEGKTLDIGVIGLKPGVNELSGVSIKGKKDFAEVRADKTVLNVEQNIMAAGGNLYDILSTAPGVKVINDEVLYRGGQKAMIAINGKPVLLTGEELANFLKNYQSSSISQIELIDNPSAKYDASSGGGMINVILKKNKDVGSNATITQSAAYGDRYKFNTALNYNLRTSKLNVFASYNFVDNKIPHSINTSRNINNGNEVNNFDLDYNADIKSRNHSYSLGADYELTSRQTIGFLFGGYNNNGDISKKSNTYIATNGQRDSSIKTLSTINRDINNLNYNLNYKANLGKSGKSTLSADFDYSNYHRHSDEKLENSFFDAADQPDGNPLFYTDNSPSHIKIRSENIDFTQVISKASSIDIGLKNSQVSSNNMIDFEQLVNNGSIPVPSLTDHFTYSERINAAYLGFKSKFDKTSLSISLRGEQTNSSGESFNPNRQFTRNYFNLFPSAQITSELDKNNKLTVFYTRNINRPNYQDLNPFVGYVDQFYYSTGNPFLKPAYINTFQVSDLYLNQYKAALSVVITNNYFNTIFQQDNATNVYITTKANLGTRYQYLAQISARFDITNWWQVNANMEAFYERYGYNTDTVANRNATGVIFFLNQNFKLTSKLSAQLNGDYESPTYYVISQYTSLYYVDAALSYSILKDKGSIKLAASDIFNTYMNKYHTNFSNLDITARDKLGSRFITATFSFRFGNSSAKTRSNTSDEQKRLGGSSNEN